jgi:hypothetical protein
MYAVDITKIFCSTLYKSLVGNFLYLTTARPDIMYASDFVSKFMESPKDSH